MASELKPCQIADALEKCDWAGASIGNKLIVLSAIEALRNTRPAPAATDTGLETVSPKDYDFYEDGELVTRSQAEELLAAERVKYEAIVDSLRIQLDRVNALEADNAAKDARVEFLERVWKKTESHTEALEAKLTAAEKALEFYADASKWNDGYFKSEDDGTVLRAYPSSIEKDQGDKARAALGGKP